MKSGNFEITCLQHLIIIPYMGIILFPGYDIIAKLGVFRDARKKEICVDSFYT